MFEVSNSDEKEYGSGLGRTKRLESFTNLRFSSANGLQSFANDVYSVCKRCNFVFEFACGKISM